MSESNSVSVLSPLDRKINEVFAGRVVRKDLIKEVRGNAVVPSYVLEYLLGQYCTTCDEDSIRSGIESVKAILSRHYVHKNEAELVRSQIRESGGRKIIDKVSVILNEKNDCYEASFFNLGLSKVVIDSDTVKKNPKLLVSGIWCIADLSYLFTENEKAVPWILNSLKPIQMAYSDLEGYKEGRRSFTLDEWLDVLMQSIGLNPEYFSRRGKLIQLSRLIPFCERNFNMIELGPKGTGKSHIYSELSPHGMLLSGGEVTVPKLFVNNGNGKVGLVGYWDCVAFDEFAGHEKKVDKALVDIMKNYMANKTFSRGTQTMGAEASMVFVGNTSHTVPYMLKTSDLFDDLPDKYHDSAFLDRLHCYNPGWEVDNLRQEMFSSGYGFVVDYLAEILKSQRDDDLSGSIAKYFELGQEVSARDRDGIKKTFSGLMKILFPNDDAGKNETQEILEFAMEGRKRVKDQLLRIDATFDATKFAYSDQGSKEEHVITTLEEREYPDIYHHGAPVPEENGDVKAQAAEAVCAPDAVKMGATAKTGDRPALERDASELHDHQQCISESQKGISVPAMMLPYLKGAKKITITDPYLRNFFQQRNFMEFLAAIVRQNWPFNEVTVELTTIMDEVNPDKQQENFESMRDSCERCGVHLSWEYDDTKTIHARSVVTDTGWKIDLDRGLDVYQKCAAGAFDLESYIPELRPCKRFEITFLKKK